ncbi:enoyl-CoA hydratase-related protein [Enterovirga aerilata]|uniref:Enoyl-CoA hydratase/isomerase family protein n=1 Tax=Enterovirga aerilata TaxID=2730920 RepID=A0A849I312_9HYPH|nr:enoyl-CoA hydratase/isomerase family protein [Enterovirga sp. DB1703]
MAAITLTRPDGLNAIDLETADALAAAFRTVSADETLRCVILRSGEPRAFSVGADLREFAEKRATPDEARRYEARASGMFDALRACPHPVVAQIEGYCLGSGLGLALLCDLRIGTRSSRLGMGASRTAHLIPAPYLRIVLEIVGLATAMELVLEGRAYDGRESFEKGLLTRVVPASELNAEVSATVARIVEGPPRAVRWHKAALTALAAPGIRMLDEDEPFRAVGSHDYQEGIRAFLEKREPVFSGQ